MEIATARPLSLPSHGNCPSSPPNRASWGLEIACFSYIIYRLTIFIWTGTLPPFSPRHSCPPLMDHLTMCIKQCPSRDWSCSTTKRCARAPSMNTLLNGSWIRRPTRTDTSTMSGHSENVTRGRSLPSPLPLGCWRLTSLAAFMRCYRKYEIDLVDQAADTDDPVFAPGPRIIAEALHESSLCN